jgi:hypothetical protein
MVGNRAYRRERETEREREDWGGRETTMAERENGVGYLRRCHSLILTVGLNQHLGIFGDFKQ